MADKSDLACARQIGAVVLDYGEVLCSRPSPDALAGMAGMFGIDAEKFLAIYRSSRNPYDRGDLTADAYWAELARRVGVTIDSQDIEKLRRLDVQMWSNINQEMTEWLARIHSGGFRTAILSNMQTEWRLTPGESSIGCATLTIRSSRVRSEEHTSELQSPMY